MNQLEKIVALRKARKQAFFKEIQPYMIYAIRSGLGAVIAIIALVSTAYYGYLLQADTISYDLRWVAVILVYPLLIVNPIRTFIEEGDLLFLMPAEAVVKRTYLHYSVRNAWRGQVLGLTIVWIILLPLLQKTALSAQSIWLWSLIWIGLILYKIMFVYGRWWSHHWHQARWRILEKVGRFALSAIALLSLWVPSWAMLILFCSAGGLYTVLVQGQARFSVAWSQLHHEEQRTRSRWMHFFSWFVDVETISGQPTRRKGLDFLTKWIPFRKQSTYTYLYMRIWLRTELWSMLVRLTLIGLLCIVVLDSLWGKIGSIVFFTWLTGVQLRALIRHHAHTEWLHVYPLPEGLRERSIRKLILRVHLVIIVSFVIALGISLWQWS